MTELSQWLPPNIEDYGSNNPEFMTFVRNFALRGSHIRYMTKYLKNLDKTKFAEDLFMADKELCRHYIIHYMSYMEDLHIRYRHALYNSLKSEVDKFKVGYDSANKYIEMIRSTYIDGTRSKEYSGDEENGYSNSDSDDIF
jgi:hypothetical protein